MTLAQRTSTIDAFSPARFQTMCQMADVFIRSKMLPSSIQTAEQAILIMVKGQELGLQPLQALNGINVIQGKPTVSPQLMLALINASGELEDIRYDLQETHVVCTMKRRGKTEHSERFGQKEAQNMGLNSKDNYRKQPQTMYKWRATAAAARVVFPDVIDGLLTPEEMGADVVVDQEGGMTIVADVVPAAPAPTNQPKLSADLVGRLRAKLSKLGVTNAEHYATNCFDRQITTLADLTTTEAKELVNTAEMDLLPIDEAHHLHGVLGAMGVKNDKQWATELLGHDVKSFTNLCRKERMLLLEAAEKLQEQPA